MGSDDEPFTSPAESVLDGDDVTRLHKDDPSTCVLQSNSIQRLTAISESEEEEDIVYQGLEGGGRCG